MGYEGCFQGIRGCEVVAIFEACSVPQRETSNRKSLSIKTWKFHLGQIIRTGGGVKCEVDMGFLSSISHLQMRIRRSSAQPQILDGIAYREVIKTLPIVPRQQLASLAYFDVESFPSKPSSSRLITLRCLSFTDD